MSNFVPLVHLTFLGPVWMEGKRKGSRVELAKNKLIFGYIYSTLLLLPPPQSKRTINFVAQRYKQGYQNNNFQVTSPSVFQIQWNSCFVPKK